MARRAREAPWPAVRRFVAQSAAELSWAALRPASSRARPPLAVGLAVVNLGAADRSDDHSGQTYVDAVFEALPQDAAILSYWDASTPLWHGQLVEGGRPDVLIVDDTNIVYDGWVTRERRIASLVCLRPVFILRLLDAELVPTREAYRLEPFLAVHVGAGGPSASVERPIYRVEPPAGSCGGRRPG